MTSDLALVLTLLGVTIVLFAINKPRMDTVAVIMMTALALTGIVSVDEALAGFSDPAIVLIAALFVIGEALVRTGVAQRLGDLLVRRAGRSDLRLIPLLMTIVAGVGSFMSSTGVVAIFIPVVLRISRNSGIAAGRLMMPLSVAALISGMMTLVATAPNLVVHSALVRQGYDGFNFFSFTPFGLPILVLAIGYMLIARRWLAAAKTSGGALRPRLTEWVEEYRLAEREHRLRVGADSAMVGKRLDQLDLRSSAGINIVAIERRRAFATDLIRPLAQTEVAAGDVLFLDVRGDDVDRVDALKCEFTLQELPLTGRYFNDRSQEIGMAELMVPANSRLIGRTVVDFAFRTKFDLNVVGLKRGTESVTGSLLNEKLALGDTLLVVGPWRAIEKLMPDRRDLLVLNVPVEHDEVVPAPSRAPFAIATLALVVVMMATGIVANVLAALIGCLLLGLFRCIDMNTAYRSIHWQSLVLIVGMLPFAIALQNTGGVDIAAVGLMSAIGDAGPRATLAAIFVVTAVLGLFVSNTATAVLMAPVALAMAEDAGASPYPFAMTVALAASAAFMTPVSSPVNTLVVGPGNYRFFDFVRIGVPFTFVVLLATVVLVPWVLPF